jgi:hypothetical protein
MLNCHCQRKKVTFMQIRNRNGTNIGQDGGCNYGGGGNGTYASHDRGRRQGGDSGDEQEWATTSATS